MRILLAALFLLAPVTASAAMTWTIAHDSGSAVMGESSTVRFRVTNTDPVASSTSRLTKLVLAVDKGDYDLDGGVAPTGWAVTAIDKQDRTISFTSTSCATGLARGASMIVSLQLVGAQANGDQTDRFDTNGGKTFAQDTCAGTTASLAASPAWRRVGLSAQASLDPRSLAPGDEVTVTLTITNKTWVQQNGLQPALPVSAPSATQFSRLSGPVPTSLSLAPGATGSFAWTWRAEASGAFAFSTSASNGTASSPLVATPQGSVGSFPALTSLTPRKVTNGQSVRVSVAVSNNGASPYQTVIPDPLTVSGTATATLESGPTPSQADVLPPGATTNFSWTYRIDGAAGTTFAFSGTARATAEGVAVPTDASNTATGEVAVHTLAISPSTIPDGSTSRTLGYTVLNGGDLDITKVALFAPDSAFFTPATTPSPAPYVSGAPAGWSVSTINGNPTVYQWVATSSSSYLKPGQSLRFDFVYSKIGTGVMPRTMTFTHGIAVTLTDGFVSRVEAPVTVFKPQPVSDVGSLVAISGSGKNTLIWNNPADHDGVLILRSTAGPVVAVPEAGREYRAGETIGSAVVTYADSGSFVSSYVDPLLTNGTRYYYKIFNHDDLFNYGPGTAPTSQGLFSEPTAGASGTPLWCYSTGLPMLVQPTRDSTGAIMVANQGGALTSNLVDGGERIRPIMLSGVVQSRFPIIGSLQGRSGRWAIVGDQSGRGYLVNSATGAIAWTALGTASDEHLQAPGNVQLNGSNATFGARYPGKDLVFFATRNSPLPASRTATNNRVVAVSSTDGSQVWSYQPGNLDIVSGYMALLGATNQLFVASYSNGNTQPSLRVLDTVNAGALLASFSLGDLETGVSLDWVGQQYTQALVANTAGMAYGIDLATLTKAWEVNLGAAPTSFLFPVGGGFIALLDSGVKRYVTSGSTVTLAWSATVAGASGMAVDTAREALLVSSSDGTIYEFVDGATGGTPISATRRISVSPGMKLSGPTLDTSRGRLYVGTEDGRLCTFSYP